LAIFFLFPSNEFLPISFKIPYVDNLFKEIAEIETGMAGKSSWDQANSWQKLGLVWRIRKKISQIIKDLPFYLLIILCFILIVWNRNLETVTRRDVH
jgi:hypothetical protein